MVFWRIFIYKVCEEGRRCPTFYSDTLENSCVASFKTRGGLYLCWYVRMKYWHTLSLCYRWTRHVPTLEYDLYKNCRRFTSLHNMYDILEMGGRINVYCFDIHIQFWLYCVQTIGLPEFVIGIVINLIKSLVLLPATAMKLKLYTFIVVLLGLWFGAEALSSEQRF
jgi:hypothetical protein